MAIPTQVVSLLNLLPKLTTLANTKPIPFGEAHNSPCTVIDWAMTGQAAKTRHFYVLLSTISIVRSNNLATKQHNLLI